MSYTIRLQLRNRMAKKQWGCTISSMRICQRQCQAPTSTLLARKHYFVICSWLTARHTCNRTISTCTNTKDIANQRYQIGLLVWCDDRNLEVEGSGLTNDVFPERNFIGVNRIHFPFGKIRKHPKLKKTRNLPYKRYSSRAEPRSHWSNDFCQDSFGFLKELTESPLGFLKVLHSQLWNAIT